MASENINYKNEFYAIWACASLLHVHRTNLQSVLNKCYDALQDNGIMYCSFKYGNQEVLRNGRYFNYLNEAEFNQMINNTYFKISEIYITEDVRIDRPSEMWLNAILKK